jgi:hypothetical protein
MIEGDPNTCGHVICTAAGSGPNQQTINYSTERVVGNGSFGVVFQATCLETGETVCFSPQATGLLSFPPSLLPCYQQAETLAVEGFPFIICCTYNQGHEPS